MHKVYQRIVFILLIGLSAIFSLGMLEDKLSAAITQEINVAQPELLEVIEGDSIHRILIKLSDRGLIVRDIWLRGYVKLFLKNQDVHIGAYQVQSGMMLSELLDNMVTGNVKQFEIRLVEGLRWQDWKKAILDNPAIIGDLTDEALIAQLQLEGDSLEGWLMPDTYHVTWKTSATEFVVRLHREMERYLQQEWQQRMPLLPLATPYEALIMASIIEKETALASERGLISGVFANRLEMNMRLQTDPTVIYGLGETFDGNLTRAHLKQATDYNTYVIKGLPPTPIAMPGKASIKAALNPEQTAAIYFVARGDGSHHFSETLEEHNQAVRKYQLGIN